MENATKQKEESNSMDLEQKYNFTCECGICKKEITDISACMLFKGYTLPGKNKEFGWISKVDPFSCCSQKCLDKAEIEKEEKINKAKIMSMLPEKYWNIDTDKKELLESIDSKGSYFIHGQVGAGKSVFMASIVKKFIYTKKPVLWLSYSRFIFDLQRKFKNDEAWSYVEEVADNPSTLCLDDMGAEKLTDFVRQITYFIINTREEKILPIIITSNFSLSQIDEQIDTRISSRIAGMCKVLKFSGKDRRIQK